jgi:hypothetical protein
MTDPGEVSTEDLRKAVLHLADAIRLTSAALDRLALRLGHSIPSLELDRVPSTVHETLRAANDRLVNAVDLLVKTDDENPS